MVTSRSRSFPAVIDVTRSVSRAGYGSATGVDRVETAYLDWCLNSNFPLYGLARIASGFAFLDRDGLEALRQRFLGDVGWGSRDARALIGLKTPKSRGRAEADVRRLAVDQCDRRHLFDLIERRGSDKLIYLNVGHSNLTFGVMDAFRGNGHLSAVLLHDVIPLEYPEFQKMGSVDKFRSKIDAINHGADLVLLNSEDTRQRSMEFLDADKITAVSHLGIDAKLPTSSISGRNRPYFVTIGTIEPRKNHRILLDVWQDLKSELVTPNVPELHIVGKRGWRNEDVFVRLDALRSNDLIHEHNDMRDDQLWALLAGANALLFPSLAEGFGLPSLEAASLGVPIICGDLAIHRELLGETPVYLNLLDPYLWKKTITEYTKATGKPKRPKPHIPTWDEHFSRVNRAITDLG